MSMTLLARRTAVPAAVLCAVAVVAAMHGGTLETGRHLLAGADRDWLSVGLLAAGGLWVAGTLTQLGSCSARLPAGRLFAAQVAGSFLNHLVPAGLGAMAVNVRFLQRAGMTRPAAVAAISLNSCATLVTHVLLLLGALVLAPSLLTQPLPLLGLGRGLTAPDGTEPAAWVLSALTGLCLVTMRRVGLRWATAAARRVGRAAAEARRELRALGGVLRDPLRAAQLWLGAFASPLLHAAILLAVLRAIGSPVPVVSVLEVYVVMSALAALVPSPGGLGALDVALVAGLVAVGAPVGTAVAAALGYRLLTVWIPLLPGAAVFAGLVHRQVI